MKIQGPAPTPGEPLKPQTGSKPVSEAPAKPIAKPTPDPFQDQQDAKPLPGKKPTISDLFGDDLKPEPRRTTLAKGEEGGEFPIKPDRMTKMIGENGESIGKPPVGGGTTKSPGEEGGDFPVKPGKPEHMTKMIGENGESTDKPHNLYKA